MKEIIVYTDGSACAKGVNKGKGGFGTYFPNLNGKKKAYSLGFINTKIGRMEVTALYYAIKAISAFERINLIVYSDSEYVVKTFTERRLQRWIKEDFVGKKNVDLWKKIVELLKCRPYLYLKMRHIRSHQVQKEKCLIKKARLMKDTHIMGNMIADSLANYKRFISYEKSDKL